MAKKVVYCTCNACWKCGCQHGQQDHPTYRECSVCDCKQWQGHWTDSVEGHSEYCLLGVYDDEFKRWTINLSQYHRDNLLWLLNACGWGREDLTVPPFNCANTGDWNGEIPQMLSKPNEPFGERGVLKQRPPETPYGEWTKYDQPNCSTEELKRRVADWLKAECVE